MEPQENQESIVLEAAHELFDQLGIQPDVAISFDPETNYYTLQIDAPNPGMVIGYRGETLAAIQYILGQILRTKTGEWLKIIVNVGDYRQQREETLRQLAQNAAQRVEFSKEPYIFTNLTPPERRVIHMMLQEHPAVMTESRGEGRQRQLVVLPKN